MQANLLKTVALATFLGSLGQGLSAQQGEQQQGDAGVQTATEGDRSALLTLRLKDRPLVDVVESIRRKANVNIIMDQSIDESVTIDLKDVPWRQALELVAEAAGCIVIDKGSGVLKVEKPPRVYFAFENADIQKVIDTIAKISGANIVVSPDVKGPITLRLKDVPWRDALEAAVKTLGFVVVEEDRGILRVVPAANIQKDLIIRHFQLRYLRPESTYMPLIDSEYVQSLVQITPRPADLLKFKLLEMLESILTEVGRMDYMAGINVIIVKDTKPVVDEIARILDAIDVEPAQVALDVRFVTTTNEDLLDIGISPGGSGWTASIGGGQIPHRLPFNLGAGGFEDSLIANDLGVGPFADELLNPTGSTIVPDVVFGALDFTQMTATLRLLKRDSRTKIVQAPKLVALDHQTATIFVGEGVRYAQARVEQGQAGGLLLALEEGDDSPVNVGFQLLAVPHIVPGTDKVILDIIPQRTALSGGGATALAPAGFDVFTVGTGGSVGQIALPRVSSSTIATKVLLRSGQTAVLGGLVTENQTETETKIPLLGDIPFLGYLFKNKVKNDTRSTLLVFITPWVIRSAEDTMANVERILRERQNQAFRAEMNAIFGAEGD